MLQQAMNAIVVASLAIGVPIGGIMLRLSRGVGDLTNNDALVIVSALVAIIALLFAMKRLSRLRAERSGDAPIEGDSKHYTINP